MGLFLTNLKINWGEFQIREIWRYFIIFWWKVSYNHVAWAGGFWEPSSHAMRPYWHYDKSLIARSLNSEGDVTEAQRPCDKILIAKSMLFFTDKTYKKREKHGAFSSVASFFPRLLTVKFSWHFWKLRSLNVIYTMLKYVVQKNGNPIFRFPFEVPGGVEPPCMVLQTIT